MSAPTAGATPSFPTTTTRSSTVLAGAWKDWSDGRERVGSALLLQELLRRGWGDQCRLDRRRSPATSAFVVEHVVRPDGTVLDYARAQGAARLYNFPWFARFLLDAGELDLAARVMTPLLRARRRALPRLRARHVVRDLAGRPARRGARGRGRRPHRRLLAQAAHYLAYGDELPAHEVNYEQSIVAPLLDLLLAARPLDPPPCRPTRSAGACRWLTRLRRRPAGRAVRAHADPPLGRLLVRRAPAVGRRVPPLLVDPQRRRLPRLAGRAAAGRRDRRAAREAAPILRGNLVAFGPDGSATCAFVYPSCVNGRPRTSPTRSPTTRTGRSSTPSVTASKPRRRLPAWRGWW